MKSHQLKVSLHLTLYRLKEKVNITQLGKNLKKSSSPKNSWNGMIQFHGSFFLYFPFSREKKFREIDLYLISRVFFWPAWTFFKFSGPLCIICIVFAYLHTYYLVRFFFCLKRYWNLSFLLSFFFRPESRRIVMAAHFRNKMLMLDAIVQWNTSKFAIFLEL